MPFKYRLTNTSASRGGAGRNIFLIDMGRLLKPGDVWFANRIDPGTRLMSESDTPDIKIEEGVYEKPTVPEKAPPPPEKPVQVEATSGEPENKAPVHRVLGPDEMRARLAEKREVKSKGSVEELRADDKEITAPAPKTGDVNPPREYTQEEMQARLGSKATAKDEEPLGGSVEESSMEDIDSDKPAGFGQDSEKTAPSTPRAKSGGGVGGAGKGGRGR